tara:strand:- start:3 stop:371 length:369 start_codon:yes stop_codon:yes gene_type:complete
MAIDNVTVVDTTSKYIVKSTGIGSEDYQKMIEPSEGNYGAEKLEGGDTDSKVSLIECYYLIEGTGTLTISADAEHPNTLSLTGKGKYGLRPNQLKFGNDKQIKLTTDSNVKSYLLVTEFRRN